MVTACVAFAFFAAPVGAESEIDIPFDDLIFGAPGSVILLAEVAVDEELVGQTCQLAVIAENQSSVHIGNDLIVSTGTSQAVIVGVEDEANGGTNRTYEMVVGPTVMVQIRIGQDGMSSLGFGLSFDCDQLPGSDLGQQVTDQPVETTTTTTAPPPTTAPTTATTTASVPATVAGAVTNSLPQTPPAQAVTGAPAYTG